MKPCLFSECHCGPALTTLKMAAWACLYSDGHSPLRSLQGVVGGRKRWGEVDSVPVVDGTVDVTTGCTDEVVVGQSSCNLSAMFASVDPGVQSEARERGKRRKKGRLDDKKERKRKKSLSFSDLIHR